MKIIMQTFIAVMIMCHQVWCNHVDFKKQEWKSWSGQGCSPLKIFYPQTLTDIQDLVQEAYLLKIPLRFLGSGHSLNDLVCSDGYLVNTDAFTTIFEVDEAHHRVRVSGGMKLKELFKRLARYNLALENQGFIKEQSVAGALATGTHGSGKTGILSDFIVSVELIDGTGEYRFISDTSYPDLLEAARLNLGALGFVYAVTLECVPLFVVDHARVIKTWDDVLANFESYYTNNDYLMFMAHPSSSQVLVYTWNKTKDDPTYNLLVNLADFLLMNEVTNYFTIKAASFVPGFINGFIDKFFTALERKNYREYCYKALSPVKNPLAVHDYIEEEIAIPIAYFKDAVHDIFSLYGAYKKMGFEMVGFMTCRFVKGSRKCLLSPAYDQDSVYISLTTLTQFDLYKEFYKAFEQRMGCYTYARPHWGKYNQFNFDQAKAVWGDSLTQFNKVRMLCDPAGILSNNYLRERLGS